jgi:peptidyl-prolyl cis-trans isomerase C
VGVVGSRRITRHDVDSIIRGAPSAVLEEETSGPEAYRNLIERILEQEAFYQAAVEAGTESDPAYRAELAAYTRQLLVRHYYQKVERLLPPVPDSLARVYYDEHGEEFQFPARAFVRHIMVSTRAKAEQVRKRLKAGDGWDAVCARYSTDQGTAKDGGRVGRVVADVDLIPGIGRAPAIVAAAFRLKEGETSEPLKTDRGWHIIRVDQMTPAGTQGFELVKERILAALGGERGEAFQTTLIDSLKKRFGATVFDDSLELAMRPSRSPADLLQAVQGAESPPQQIEIFRQLVARYPKDKAAAQAQFMIGFTYAEELGDFASARKELKVFLEMYPDSDLVESAKWMLENMENSKLPPGVGLPGDSSGVIITPPQPTEGAGTKP